MLDRSTLRRASLLPVLLVMAAGLFVVVGCGDDETNVTFPQPIPEDPNPWFFDVWGTAADDVWVAGALGAMYHLTNSDWSDTTNWVRVDMGTDQGITSLYSSGDGSAFACGHGGNIWRNPGSGSWSAMTSGTDEHLFRLGSYDGALHAVGLNGTALVYDGSWSPRPGTMVTRNPKEGDAVVDTLLLAEDVVTLTAVNHYMIGGAYLRKDTPDTRVGIEGTVGFFMKDDEPIVCPDCDPPIDERGLYDWKVTVVGDDPEAVPEWVVCSHSDDSGDLGIGNNWFGTSTGWLFRLTEDVLSGDLNWIRYSLQSVTSEERFGVRDIWLAPAADPVGAPNDRDLYMVTDDGLVVKQQPDGTRETLVDVLQSLVSIWGTGPDNMYVTGYMNERILHVNHDPVAGTTVVTTIKLRILDAKAAGARSDFDIHSLVDELGRPRF
ncbi:hypothetical protein DRQ50_00680 [bacterium]|nr:MAG: hypothetical protein DRQ50_00680 [bacterium]